MSEVELVTDKCSGGPAVNEGGEDLEGFAELDIEVNNQVDFEQSCGRVWSAGQGGDIKGDGLWVLQSLAVKVEGEILPIYAGVGGVKPGEAQDEGGGGM
ncbi:hypothetical protein C0993_008469 [Termitomyces sp. T159_Od127]|nr:hypothetical protein C0993_008469 [Termitomyces sp. T159_Od127]